MSNSPAAYGPVRLSVDEDDEEDVTVHPPYSDHPPKSDNVDQPRRSWSEIQPLEILEEDDECAPCQPTAGMLSSAVSLLSLVPLILGMGALYQISGRVWTCTPVAAHTTLQLLLGWQQARSESERRRLRRVGRRCRRCHRRGIICRRRCGALFLHVHAALDVVLFIFVYPLLRDVMMESFLTEPDGTVAIEWTSLATNLIAMSRWGYAIAGMRVGVSLYDFQSRLNVYSRDRELDASLRAEVSSIEDDEEESSNNARNGEEPFQNRRGKCLLLKTLRSRADDFLSVHGATVHQIYCRFLLFSMVTSALFFLWCVQSALVHLPPWKAPTPPGLGNTNCDPLDLTECALPFPSSYHLVKDSTTETGWRVNLKGDSLPALKGNIRMDPTFANQLDGFSTMAPIMFYLDGLKEAHDKGVGAEPEGTRLRGMGDIDRSTTAQSITLLLDVKAKKLVYHIAELDHLNDDHPLVMVTPARPLDHNTHYALVVANARDGDGNLIAPTRGLTDILHPTASSGHTPGTTHIAERAHRFKEVVIPSLKETAPWFDDMSNPTSLQLLFDFHTVSASSQIGPLRAVRDAALAQIRAPEWGGWGEHNVRVIRTEEEEGGGCNSGYGRARSVHVELDVPWFLMGHGPGHRGAVLNEDAVSKGKADIIGKAKFVVHVPCSIKAGALNHPKGTELRTLLEYGHGLFADRQEASQSYLLNLANENGYLILAMDWRGMSKTDLLIAFQTLMSKPRLFQSVRDNLIQGYVNKMVMVHFARNGMLDMEWLQFGEGDERKPILRADGKAPCSFYGNSQGGILGAGYSAMMGATGLIDRSVLGVPGTPFALILTRSLDFIGYDTLMLLNFYHNRHVRIFLSVMQMGWDSVEGSGLLAGPVSEPYPPVLIQAGLGDAEVPTIAAEALSRAYNASVLPGHPREVYGVQSSAAADDNSDGPRCALTEILFKEEYGSLPVENTVITDNIVHMCVRHDAALQQQAAEFINSGRIIDPCATDNCIRERANCAF